MTFSDACLASLLRALAAGLLVIPLSRWQCEFLNQRRATTRNLALCLLLVPFFTPELIVGYAYAKFSLLPAIPALGGSESLQRGLSQWVEHFTSSGHVLYVFLMAMKVAPVAALARQFAPQPAITDEALHCHRLLRQNAASLTDWRIQHWSMWCRGPLRRAAIPFAIGFLFVFQEFEIASLMAIPAWTVHLFDAQFQGLQLSVTLQRVVFPIAIELLVIVPILLVVARRQPVLGDSAVPVRMSTRANRLGFVSLLLSVFFLTILPCHVIGTSGFNGLSLFWKNSVMLSSFAKELMTGFLLAAAASVGAWLVSGFLLRQSTGPASSKVWRIVTVAICVPGLAGPLAISLQILTIIQLPGVSSLRSTPFPSLLAFLLFLLPRAIMLLAAFRLLSTRQSSDALASFVARSRSPKSPLSVASLSWHVFARSHFWVLVALFYWGFTNLTVSSILNPPSIVPLPVRLYNLMHYGQNGPLSVMALLSVVAPLTLIGLFACVVPRLARLRQA